VQIKLRAFLPSIIKIGQHLIGYYENQKSELF